MKTGKRIIIIALAFCMTAFFVPLQTFATGTSTVTVVVEGSGTIAKSAGSNSTGISGPVAGTGTFEGCSVYTDTQSIQTGGKYKAGYVITAASGYTIAAVYKDAADPGTRIGAAELNGKVYDSNGNLTSAVAEWDGEAAATARILILPIIEVDTEAELVSALSHNNDKVGAINIIGSIDTDEDCRLKYGADKKTATDICSKDDPYLNTTIIIKSGVTLTISSKGNFGVAWYTWDNDNHWDWVNAKVINNGTVSIGAGGNADGDMGTNNGTINIAGNGSMIAGITNAATGNISVAAGGLMASSMGGNIENLGSITIAAGSGTNNKGAGTIITWMGGKLDNKGTVTMNGNAVIGGYDDSGSDKMMLVNTGTINGNGLAFTSYEGSTAFINAIKTALGVSTVHYGFPVYNETELRNGISGTGDIFSRINSICVMDSVDLTSDISIPNNNNEVLVNIDPDNGSISTGSYKILVGNRGTVYFNNETAAYSSAVIQTSGGVIKYWRNGSLITRVINSGTGGGSVTAETPATTTTTMPPSGTGAAEVTTTTKADVAVSGSSAIVTIPSDVTAKVVEQTAAAEKNAASAGAEVDSEIVIIASTGTASKIEIVLPASALNDIAVKTGAALTIKTAAGDATMDQTVLDKTTETAGTAGDVRLVIQKVDETSLTTAAQSALGAGAVVIKLEIVTLNGNVTKYPGGAITLSIPADGIDAALVSFVNVTDNGWIRILPFTSAGGRFRSDLPHLSYYAYISKEAAEKAVEVQNATIKAGVQATKIVGLKTAVSKSKVKLAWRKTSGYAVDGYQIWKSSTSSSKGYKLVRTVSVKSYTNTAGLKSGQTYWYKVRGYRTIDGVKVYTSFAKVKVVAK